MTSSLVRLFVDLDGVLADFDRGVQEITGRHPSRHQVSRMWQQLASHEDFFGSLHLTADGLDLWEHLIPLEPTILTGLPRGSWAAPQKRAWVARTLGQDVEVITCMSRDKHLWSAPGHVLIDDTKRHREPWKAKGGVFIHHQSTDDTLAEMRRMGWLPDPQGA